MFEVVNNRPPEQLANLDPNLALAHLDVVLLHPRLCRVRTHPRVQVKLPEVPRTCHHVALHVSAREIPARMRTRVVDYHHTLRIIKTKNRQLDPVVLDERPLP